MKLLTQSFQQNVIVVKSIYCGWLNFRGVPILVVSWRVRSMKSSTLEKGIFGMNYEGKCYDHF